MATRKYAALPAAAAIVICMTLLLMQGKHVKIISLAFDDGYESQYSAAFGAMREMGIAGTVYLIANSSPSFEGLALMSDVRALEMQSSGWEIGSHGLNHRNLTGLGNTEIDTELSASKQSLESRGFNVRSFSFPYSKYNDYALAQVRKGYASALPSLWGYNEARNIDPYLLKSMWVDSSTDVSDACLWVSALPDGGWLILRFHQIGEAGTYGISEGTFREILGCVNKSGAAVMTVSEAVDYYTSQK